MLCFLPTPMLDQLSFFHLQATETKSCFSTKGNLLGRPGPPHGVQGRPEPQAIGREKQVCPGHPSNGRLWSGPLINVTQS